jgi:hypothetical protein
MIMIKRMTMSSSGPALHTDWLPGHQGRARPASVLGGEAHSFAAERPSAHAAVHSHTDGPESRVKPRVAS